MSDNYCPYCMTTLREDGTCPECGLTAGNYVPQANHLPPQTLLADRYLVGRVLGEGGFGITYLGRDLRLDTKVAIKEYYPRDRAHRDNSISLEVSNYMGPQEASYKRGRDKFLAEARTMALMAKQHVVVSVRDYFEEHNTAYIVMEYIEGTTLGELAAQRGGRIPAEELFGIVEPLFGALSEFHSKGLIHRDISPDNLMLEGGQIRLLDFGLAREGTTGTQTMTVALKHEFAPTEQYTQKGQGPWTDVFSLCATLYKCLTGKLEPAIDRITLDELKRPSELGVEIEPRQEAALMKGLRLEISQRFQSMDELWAALYTDVLGEGPVIVKPPVEEPPVQPGSTAAGPTGTGSMGGTGTTQEGGAEEDSGGKGNSDGTSAGPNTTENPPQEEGADLHTSSGERKHTHVPTSHDTGDDDEHEPVRRPRRRTSPDKVDGHDGQAPSVTRRNAIIGAATLGMGILGLIAWHPWNRGGDSDLPVVEGSGATASDTTGSTLGDSRLQDVRDALSKGLVDASLADVSPDQTVLSTEFRSWLANVIERADGDMTYFDEKVTVYECELLRGDAIMMCYYAAVATGQDSHNGGFDISQVKENDPDWLDPKELHFIDLCPSFAEQLGPITLRDEDNPNIVYDRELDAASDWVFWHVSATGRQVIEYDEAAESMRAFEPLTLEEAVAAVGRLGEVVE